MRVGDVLLAQRNLAGAHEAYRRSLALAEGLGGSDPGNSEWQRDLAVNIWKVATVLVQQGNLSEALKLFRRGRSLIAALQTRAPYHSHLSTDLAEFDGEIARLEKSPAGTALPADALGY